VSGTTEHKPSKKDQAADLVMDRLMDLESELSDRRKNPAKVFVAFAQAVRRYAEVTKGDALIHKTVASEVHGLRNRLGIEGKRITDDMYFELERLECLVFSGYDPYFEGDEPPGL
jgi:hypothetical protein